MATIYIPTTVNSRSISAPPETPVRGSRYIVAENPSGVWASHAMQITTWDGSRWKFIIPTIGVSTWVLDEALEVTFDGSLWKTSADINSAIFDESSITTTCFPTWVLGSGPQAISISSSKLSFTPNTGNLASSVFTGSGAGLTEIPNGALVNSSLRLGTSIVALGEETLSLAGLVSIAATTFLGALSGNASSATVATNLAGGNSGYIPYQTGVGGTSFIPSGVGVLVGGAVPSFTQTPSLQGLHFSGIPGSAISSSVSSAIATGITDSNESFNTVYPTWVSEANGESSHKVSSSKLTFIPATGVLYATGFSGSGALLTDLPNGSLSNSSIMIGSTSISLGESTSSLSNLTSVSASTFVGNLSGTASAATSTINLSGGSPGAVPFQSSEGITSFASGAGVLVGGLAPSFSTSPAIQGFHITDIPGSAISSAVASADTATKLVISSDTWTSTPVYPIWAGAIGEAPLRATESSLSFIPSTGVLSAIQFEGSGAGLSGIPNSSLVNSTVSIGTTTLSLGGSVDTLEGLTSVAATTFVGDLTGNAATVSTNANLLGDVSSLGNVTQIGVNKVTLPHLALVGSATFLGRSSESTGNVEELSATQATSLLNVFGTSKGLVPGVTPNASQFLCADGTFSTPTGTGVASISATLPILSSGGTSPVISIPAAISGVDGYMSGDQASKLALLEAHPLTHPPSIIEQDSLNRFVTDAEKTSWNTQQFRFKWFFETPLTVVDRQPVYLIEVASTLKTIKLFRNSLTILSGVAQLAIYKNSETTALYTLNLDDTLPGNSWVTLFSNLSETLQADDFLQIKVIEGNPTFENLTFQLNIDSN